MCSRLLGLALFVKEIAAVSTMSTRTYRSTTIRSTISISSRTQLSLPCLAASTATTFQCTARCDDLPSSICCGLYITSGVRYVGTLLLLEAYLFLSALSIIFARLCLAIAPFVRSCTGSASILISRIASFAVAIDNSCSVCRC